MNSSRSIYLDYAASTPLDERVLDAMLPFFTEAFGNSSSTHRFGQKADAAIEDSRERLASGLNCSPDEVVFTSCGSESDNLALRGASLAIRKMRDDANHILVPPTEHPAVLRTAIRLAEDFGFEVEFLPVDRFGMTHAKDVAALIRPTTALVSVMYSNNEIGTINPIAEIGLLCRENGILFHTDAVQGAAYLSVDVDLLNVDLLSLGAHKFYGPKGVGALYIRKGTPIAPIITGGSQEFGIRAGTANTPYLVGFGRAFELAQNERVARTHHVQLLRDHLIGKILEEIPDSQLTGHPTLRMPNHASFVFRGVNGNDLLTFLDTKGFACSSGSACKTGNPEPSEVIKALGYDDDWNLGSLRITLGSATKIDDVESFLEVLPTAIEQLRKLNAKNQY